MSEEEDIPITYKPGTLSGKSEPSVDKADTEEYSENLLGRKFIERATEVAKDRRYVDDPSDAPDDVDVEQGPQGGHYYETGSSGDEEGSNNTPNTSDGETLWEAELATNYDEGDSVVVDTERVGEIEGTIPEGGLDFLEYDELVVEDTEGTEHIIPTEEIQGLESQGGKADKRMREVMDELREVDSEQLSRGDEKGADPKNEDVEEAAEYLAQELGGDVEPGDVVDAVQTDHRVQPDDEE